MSAIIFRKASVDEGPILSELSLRSKSFWKYSPEFLATCRPHLIIDEEYIHNWPVIILEVAHAILGYYSLKVVGFEQRLDNLWLDLEYIGKGFGTLAITHAKEQARIIGWDHFYLASEPGAVAFYAKNGGKLVGYVPSKLDENLKLPHIKFTL